MTNIINIIAVFGGCFCGYLLYLLEKIFLRQEKTNITLELTLYALITKLNKEELDAYYKTAKKIMTEKIK